MVINRPCLGIKIAFYRKVIIDINLISITFGGSKLNYPVLLVQMVINNPRSFGVCVFTRLDDHFWAHPKVLNCSDGALALWARALSWVGFQLTDGFVPHQCLRLLRGQKRDADRLVAAGLWERGECDGQLGYWFHDFTDWNNAATREEVEKRRKRGHDRVIKHREKTTDWPEPQPENTSNPGRHGNKPVDHSPTPHVSEADTLPVLAEETTTSATSLPAYSAPPGPNLETMTAPAAAPTPATAPAAQPKPAMALLRPDTLPATRDQSPADWSTMDDPRCRKHAGLPRGQVPPCWACGQVRLWFTQQALAVKQEQRNMVACCEYCDERGIAETQDGSGKHVLIRCKHDGPPPILPAPEEPQHRPPPPEIRERIAKLGQPKPTKHQPLVLAYPV